ncbi:acyl transferase/acyl hydrolase/lysophospholipase [Gloeopeniophorella convolvens]|nr:acyl transferase/acyl hydrolase/lysophospholipase [Gloeopeniophorella convolvens]
MPSAENQNIVLKTPPRILSLDGGGYRGLSSLEILDRLMNEMKDPDGRVPKPCEVFDLIIGTSTGGLIAILLGRLRYTVSEAKEAYLTLGDKIFGTVRSKDDSYFFKTGREKLDERPFEQCLQQLVGDQPLLDPLATSGDDFCYTVITTTVKGSVNSPPVLLRTYPNSEPVVPQNHTWLIKQAARATSAAPTYFASVHLGDKIFEDAGASKCNNPVRQGVFEVDRIPTLKGRPIGCVVSIGTGLGDLLVPRSEDRHDAEGRGPKAWVNYGRNLAEAPRRIAQLVVYLAGIASDTYNAHEEMTHDPILKDVYYRFNVPGLGKIDLADISQKETLIKETQNWLATQEGRDTSRNVPSLELSPPAFSNPAVCVGRDNVIKELVEVFASALVSQHEFRPQSAIIKGPAGIGKTTIALRILNDRRTKEVYGNRICFIRCDGSKTIENVKSKLLLMRKIKSDDASDEAVRQLLTARPTLIVLDNFEELLDSPGDIQQAIEQEFLPLLAKNASLLVTVRGNPTLRLEVAGGWKYKASVTALDDDQARAAFLDYADISEPKDASEKEALNKLVVQSEGHPLTIALLARMTSTRSLSEILRKLELEKSKAVADPGNKQNRSGSLDASIRITVASPRVAGTAEAVTLCCILALLPDGASRDLLQSGLIASESVIDEAKAALIASGLAYVEPAFGLLRMLSPLRLFFADPSQEDQKAWKVDSAAVESALRKHYFALAKINIFLGENADRRLRLAQTRNVELIVTRALRNPSTDKTEWTDVVEAAAGIADWTLWQIPRQPPYLLKALEICRKRNSPILTAKCLLELGELTRRDAPERAEEFLGEASDAFLSAADDESLDDETRLDCQQSAAIACEHRGCIAMDLGKFDLAALYLSTALEVYRLHEMEQGQVNALNALADLALKGGDNTEAVSLYKTSIEIAHRIGDALGEANINSWLADLTDDVDVRKERLESAAALYETADRVDKAVEIRALLAEL